MLSETPELPLRRGRSATCLWLQFSTRSHGSQPRSINRSTDPNGEAIDSLAIYSRYQLTLFNMDESKTGFSQFNLIGTAIDAGLAAVMFALFFTIIIPEHAPVFDPAWKTFWSAYTSAVMAGFWFLFFTLFRVTLVDQLRGKAVSGPLAPLARTLHYAESRTS